MDYQPEIGTKVSLNGACGNLMESLCPELKAGLEVTVAQHGGRTTFHGVVIVHPTFSQSVDKYPEHGIWVDEKFLDPID